MAQEVAFGWNDDAGYYLANRKVCSKPKIGM
jgi:hypothetical protein